MSAAGGPSLLMRAAELGRGLVSYPSLERAQWLSPERVQALQWQRLQQTIEQAAAHSPLYRQRFAALGIQPRDIRSLDDFRKLPITTREDLRAPDGLLADNFPRNQLRESMTSGSTGRRTTSYFDERAWVHAKYLVKLRARRACGLQPWHKVALFQEDGGTALEAPAGKRTHTFSIHRPIAEILPGAQRFAAEAYYGFPGYFVRLAEAAQGSLRPRMIFTSGELLDPFTRRAIEDGFKAPVFDVYGCTEVKEVAWECPAHAGHHLNADWILFEVDPPGDAGKVLLTPLYNRAMPLLRYQVGDTGMLLSERCPCGRGLPLIRPTLGRSVDYLQLPDGNMLPPYTLTCAVEAVEGMRQYQFVQTEPRRIELRIVPGADFGAESEAALRNALAPVLPGVDVGIELVPTIAAEPSGKYRIVKTLVEAPGPAR